MMHISVNSVAITVVSLTAGNARLSVFGLSACVCVCVIMTRQDIQQRGN